MPVKLWVRFCCWLTLTKLSEKTYQLKPKRIFVLNCSAIVSSPSLLDLTQTVYRALTRKLVSFQNGVLLGDEYYRREFSLSFPKLLCTSYQQIWSKYQHQRRSPALLCLRTLPFYE